MATFVATQTTTTTTTGTTWPNVKNERITAPRSSDLVQLEAQFNGFVQRFSAYLAALATDSAVTTITPSTGTTNTLATSAGIITIAGVPVLVAATTANAVGGIGTIAASKWGILAVDAIANGTITCVFASGGTAGFATEALAIAAIGTQLAKTANKARVGYITVLASASTWVAGTDGFAAGSGGNVATTTNFYAVLGTNDTGFWTSFVIANLAGQVVTTANSY